MSPKKNRWSELPIGVRLRIDKVCDRFREALHKKASPLIEAFLAAEPDFHDELFARLLEEEMSWRQQIHSAMAPDEFHRRFPDKRDLISEVFQLFEATVSGQPNKAESTSTNLASGKVGSRFRLIKLHARGGLGEVFVAEDLELHREVALKEIQEEYAGDADSRSRFLLEAEITGRLEHPGIVAVYSLGRYQDGRPFYAMRFIKGDNLRDVIKRFHQTESPGRDPGERTLAFRDMLGRFVDACNAVAFAHSRGILHRDLKPSNIMLGKYGETLVVDWGLAKPLGHRGKASEEATLKPASASANAETLQGLVIGTPAFMSPEQAAGRLDQLGPATDVYSLGATLFCLLTGKPPIEEEDLREILQKVQRGDFPKPSQLNAGVPPALEAICSKAMALNPVDRYDSPQGLAEDIEHWLADEPVKAWPEPWKVRLGRFLKHHRSRLSAAIMVILIALFNLSLIVSGVLGCLLSLAIVLPAWIFLKKPLWRGITLGSTCALCAWLLPQTSLIGLFEERMLDSFFCYRGQRATTAKVIMISLDDDFLGDLRKPLIYISPEIAEVVTYAKGRGAVAIGLNLIVPGELALLPDLQEGGPGDVTKLGRAIQDANNVVLAELKQKNGWLRPLPQWRFKEFLELEREPGPDLARLGFVNLTEDDDLFVRRQQLLADDEGRTHLHFALALAVRARGERVDPKQGLLLGSKRLPLDEEQKLRINFVGPGAFPVVPLSKVLAAARGIESVPVNVEGATVIIDATTPNQPGRHPTPYTSSYWSIFRGSLGLMPGSEIHANILATIYDDAFILPAPPWLAGLPMLLAFGAILGFAFVHLNPEMGCVLAVLHHVGWLMLGLLAFARFHWQVPIAPMLLVGLLTYAVAIALRWHSLTTPLHPV